mmetsp:Transcript_28300/g.76206  ORF Transcript_28300/g.76206 Transcript_28300/m.76206 type:complete len:221 (-) Transcript_28300:893-1555(-)
MQLASCQRAILYIAGKRKRHGHCREAGPRTGVPPRRMQSLCVDDRCDRQRAVPSAKACSKLHLLLRCLCSEWVVDSARIHVAVVGSHITAPRAPRDRRPRRRCHRRCLGDAPRPPPLQSQVQRRGAESSPGSTPRRQTLRRCSSQRLFARGGKCAPHTPAPGAGTRAGRCLRAGPASPRSSCCPLCGTIARARSRVQERRRHTRRARPGLVCGRRLSVRC